MSQQSALLLPVGRISAKGAAVGAGPAPWAAGANSDIVLLLPLELLQLLEATGNFVRQAIGGRGEWVDKECRAHFTCAILLFLSRRC